MILALGDSGGGLSSRCSLHRASRLTHTQLMRILRHRTAIAARHSAHSTILALMMIVQILNASTITIRSQQCTQAGQHVEAAAVQLSLRLTDD